MIVEFELPDELQGLTYEKILSGMLEKIPAKYDKTEGGFVYDMVAPSALEAAELIQFWLALAVQTNFHMWAKGRWLEYHAQECGLKRREATYAYGDVIVTITQPVTFMKGFVFSVPAQNGTAALDFETVSINRLTEEGTYKIRVKAVLPGVIGNVKGDSITIMKVPVGGVALITNEPTTGGTEPESDESLRQRIDDFYAGRQASFVGNKRDYIRWAREVPGVGYAHCIPTFNGENTVKVVVADANGLPANREILAAVERHIFGTGHDDVNRLAPIGIVEYAVVAPTPIVINLSMELELMEDYTYAQVRDALDENLDAFYKTLADETYTFGTLRYVAVSAVILNTAGVADFKHLRINGAIMNVEFGEDKYPLTGEIKFNNSDEATEASGQISVKSYVTKNGSVEL